MKDNKRINSSYIERNNYTVRALLTVDGRIMKNVCESGIHADVIKAKIMRENPKAVLTSIEIIDNRKLPKLWSEK